MTTKEKKIAAETIEQMNTVLKPWIDATKAWVAETEKFQQTTFANINKAMDNGHHMAKEGIELMASMTMNMQKELRAQAERATELFKTYIS